jgi:hypothetical protein
MSIEMQTLRYDARVTRGLLRSDKKLLPGFRFSNFEMGP